MRKMLCQGNLNQHLLAILFVCTASFTSAQGRVQKVQTLYDSLIAHDIQFPKTVVAMAIFETGWMECKKCTYKDHNLWGFRANKGYMKFSNESYCISYLKKWQQKHYQPWKKRHPIGTYYQFLTYKKFARDMPAYIKKVKKLEGWVEENIN
jgi:hypothetical protein